MVGRQPGDEFAVPDGCGEPPAHLRQQPVARESSMLGVDLLEPVDVDEDERERSFVALRPPRFGTQLLVEGAVVGKVRELVARRERSQLRARIGERNRGLSGERELEQPGVVASFGDQRAPEPGSDADRRGSGSGLAAAEDVRGRLVTLERDCRARDEARGALRFAGTHDRAEAARLEADDGGGVDADVDGRLLGDDGEELDRIGLERNRVLDSLLGGADGHCGRAAEDGDDAGDDPALVAADEPATLEDDVGSILARVPLRAVRRREQVVRVHQRVGLDSDELLRGVAEQLLGSR